MADLVPECKKKLARFRLKELKDVLGQLGLVKTGRKQELVDRVLALLSGEEASNMHGPPKNKLIRKEGVAEIIDDTYRKMQHSGAIDSGTGGHCASDSSSITTKEEIVDQKVRCPCGSPLKTQFMIQCADPQCNVLQHIPCVIVVEGTPRGYPPDPSQFYCELCRINRSDPFWKTLAHPLYPVKLHVSSIADDGTNALQKVETDFQITRADVHLLEKAGHDIQAWCILLNDSVPFRLQWPIYPDLRVNGIPVKAINRPGSKMLGANGRDDGPSTSMYIVEGYNKISLSGSDGRPFCLGVRLVKQRTFQQVVNLIPSEQEGESFTDALARVCRCIGGGMAAANEDSDSDLEVIADNVTVNLRCPMSGSRMKTAIRFKGCVHLGCFDLDTFVQMNQRSKKWQCPICLRNYSLEDIIIDPYFNRIVKMMQACNEDVTEIDVKSDGSWRVKIGRPFMNLEQWHLPDGSLCISAVEVDSPMETPAEKSKAQLAMCENKYRVPNVGVPQDMHEPSSRNQLEENFTNYDHEIISMSSSSDDVKKDGPQSLDECGTRQSDITTNKTSVMDFTPYNYNQASGNTNRSSSSLADQSVIVLSDSEEENYDMVSPTDPSISSPLNCSGSSLTAHPEIRDRNSEDVAFQAAPLHPSVNGESTTIQTSNIKNSGGPFTFPRQPRTVRRRHVTTDVEE